MKFFIVDVIFPYAQVDEFVIKLTWLLKKKIIRQSSPSFFLK